MQLVVTFPSLTAITNPYDKPNADQWKLTGSFMGTQYAYAKINEEAGTLEQLHVPHSCRDYMSDYMVHGENAKEDIAAGKQYNYTGRQPHSFHGPFTPDVGLILGRGGNINEKIYFLNELEKRLHVARTKVYPTDKKGWFGIVTSEWWKRTSLHWSWYMQCLRYLNDPAIKRPGDREELTKQSGSTHLGYMSCPEPWDFWKFPIQLKAMGKPTKGHCNVPRGQYYHGYGGYFNFMQGTCRAFAMGRPQDAKGYVYTQELYQVLKEEKEKCAASPVTAS